MAAAVLGVSEPLLRPLALAALRCSPDFMPAAAPNLLWACAALGLREESLLRSLLDDKPAPLHVPSVPHVDAP